MASNDETTDLSTTDLSTTDAPTTDASTTELSASDPAPADAAGADGPVTADADADAPAPAKKVTRKRAPRKATAAKTTPAHHEAEPVESTLPAADAAAGEAAGAPAGQDDAAPAEAPVKKAARKRAPRKATAKKTAVVPAAEVGPLTEEEADETLVAAAASGETAQSAAASDAVDTVGTDRDTTGAAGSTVSTEPGAEPQVSAPAVPTGLGLLFQAPDPTVAPRRRRATAPATAPAPAAAQAATAPANAPEAQAEDEGRRTAARDADADANGSTESVDADADSEGGGRRRRRRGGKGRRGRTTGEAVDTDETSAEAEGRGDEATEDTTGPADSATEETDENENENGPSRRRTRRRRRGAGSGENEEQPGVVTRIREPREPREPRKERDEVTSVKGSTRLEAKKQRRREGREAGRRRTIITEAEFLARRESVERVMVVRNKEDRTQIAVLEDGVLVEHYVSRESNVSMAGNVYLGRIQNVLPSMEAAFVDIGKGRNAVLYAGEVNWDAAGLSGNRAKRIENALSSGDSVLVQVTKDPIGHKGARLTSQISLPGRYLVYVPDGNMTGISRKLPDTERARLKKILREVVPENAGVIVRTAAEGASEEELRADVARLTEAWEEIKAKAASSQTKAPSLLHGEPDLTVRVIRDVFNEDFASLVVAGEPAWSQVSGYVSSVAPDLADRVTKWTGEKDLFTHYRVDEQIAKAMDRKVWLPSGGSLVIDRTEAMTVVDVNTGKFVGSGGNLEETVTKNNIEAAEEVVRQLRLRDIGGIIVIDFIDMVLESNRDLVVRRLLECLGRDRTKHQVAEVTSLGLVQMTRKRVGSGLIEVFSEQCEHCNGRGFIIHADPVDRPVEGGGRGSDNGNRSGDQHRGGDNGNRSADSSGDGSRGSRSRRGRGGREVTPSAAESAPATPSGPTPAQIAAAAHQAALLASQVVTVDEASSEDVEPTPGAEPQGFEAAATSDVPEAGTQPVEDQQETPPVQDQQETPPVQDQQETPPVQDQQETPPVQDQQAEHRSEQPTADEPAAAQAAAADVAAEAAPAPSEARETPSEVPAPRGRRKRARVVAPAGPPGSSTAAPVGEFAEQGADHVV
jgi:ribonuclease E